MNVARHLLNRSPIAVLALAVAACSPAGVQAGAGASGADQGLLSLSASQRLTEPPAAQAARNGRTVEVSLSAGTVQVPLGDGKTAQVLAYNGSYPGPTIDVNEGDRLVVHFKNTLSEPTSLHWHGVHVPADQDNALDDVAPGGTRDFAFDIPQDSAGTYWYHPHMHGMVAEQVARGLFGVLRVRSANDPIPAAAGDTLLVLSDLKLDAAGRAVGPADTDKANGFEGDQVLVNGKHAPSLVLQPGQSRLLRVLNASASRYYRLSLPGQTLTLVGTDGGLIDRPIERQEVLLAPGERAEVIVRAPAQAGGKFTLTALPYDRGAMPAGSMSASGTSGGQVMAMSDMPMPSPSVSAGAHDMADMPGMAMSPMPGMGGMPMSGNQPVLTVLAAGNAASAVVLPAQLRSVARLGVGLPVARTLTFSEDHANADFRINGQKFDASRVDMHVKLGTTEVWSLQNTGHMDHPFHIHGFDFQVLDRNGVDEPYLGWKDTVNVKAGETVRFAVKYADYPGMRVFHCHILDHEDLGMMGVFQVDP